MMMLYNYHFRRHLNSTRTSKDIFESSLLATHQFLAKPNRHIKATTLGMQNAPIGRTTLVADVAGVNGHEVFWTGDSRIRRFSGEKEVWRNRPHTYLHDVIYAGKEVPEHELASHPYRKVISSSLGASEDQPQTDDPKIGYKNLGPLQERETLVLHSDGVIISAQRIGQIISQYPPDISAKMIVDESIAAAHQRPKDADNVSCRVITNKVEAHSSRKITTSNATASKGAEPITSYTHPERPIASEPIRQAPEQIAIDWNTTPYPEYSNITLAALVRGRWFDPTAFPNSRILEQGNFLVLIHTDRDRITIEIPRVILEVALAIFNEKATSYDHQVMIPAAYRNVVYVGPFDAKRLQHWLQTHP